MACYLSHPDFLEQFKWSVDDAKGTTVGNRMKKWLATEGQGGYQRVSPDNILDDPRSDWRCVQPERRRFGPWMRLTLP